MPYEDHLQKQIDRFAQALATLLKNIASGTYEHASTESAINEVLQEHGQSDLSKLLKFDFEELVMWFTKPPFNKKIET
ncbi:MAG: hypothetical protein R2813_06690 [Flavobacteriales bacterium]